MDNSQEQIPVPVEKSSSKIIRIFILVIIIILFILGGIAYLLFINKNAIMPQSSQTVNISQEQLPKDLSSLKVIDMGSSIPVNRKAKVIVHHSDSTFNIYLVPTDFIDNFKKAIPPGDFIVKITNPQ